MICPTCGDKIPDKIIIKTIKGPVERRGFDIDHYPDTWAERIVKMKIKPIKPTRSQVIDEYHERLRGQCPECNQSHEFEGKPGEFE